MSEYAEVEQNEGTGERDPVVRLIVGMPGKRSLMQILRTCSVFMDTDGGTRVKVVCRYQQFRGANRILDRLREGATAMVGASTHFLTHGDFAG